MVHLRSFQKIYGVVHFLINAMDIFWHPAILNPNATFLDTKSLFGCCQRFWLLPQNLKLRSSMPWRHFLFLSQLTERRRKLAWISTSESESLKWVCWAWCTLKQFFSLSRTHFLPIVFFHVDVVILHCCHTKLRKCLQSKNKQNFLVA